MIHVIAIAVLVAPVMLLIAGYAVRALLVRLADPAPDPPTAPDA